MILGSQFRYQIGVSLFSIFLSLSFHHHHRCHLLRLRRCAGLIRTQERLLYSKSTTSVASRDAHFRCSGHNVINSPLRLNVGIVSSTIALNVCIII